MNEPEYEVLKDVTQLLESAGIDFMLTGSMAMACYGQMRMTRDIDLIVALRAADVERVVRLFENNYYIDSIAVARAIAHHSMFNIISNKRVVKVDCIILKEDAHQQEQFQRRRKEKLAEIETWVISQEDLILAKLAWARHSRSEMQLRDVKSLLTGQCDFDYINQRAQAQGTSDLLVEVIKHNVRRPDVADLQ